MVRRKKPTIYTIAEAVGVAPSTVSRALNPNARHRVGANTVRRIEAKAIALGYSANKAAASLRTRRTAMLGLVVPRLTDGVIAVMSEAAEDAARQAGYQMITTSTRDNPVNEKEIVAFLQNRDVDGLVLVTTTREGSLLGQLETAGVPFVLLNRTSGSHVAVAADDELGGYLATQHLLGQGHRRIGYIGGPFTTSTSFDRLLGYRRAHAETGIDVDEALIVEATFSAEGGAVATGQLLGLVEPPTAVFAVTDQVGIGAMAAARHLGSTLPGDLAVIGYNDSALAALLPIPLSSVRLPLEEMGRSAVALLLAILNGEESTSIRVPPVLIARASSNFRVGSHAHPSVKDAL